MRTPFRIVLSGLVLGASACATVEEPMTPLPMAAAGAPSPVEDYDWFYHQDADEARLVYGLAESDDLGLGLDCLKGSGRLTLSAFGAMDATPEISLESGGEIGRFPARSEPSVLHDGAFLTAEAATNTPVFQHFRRLGWLALWQEGERQAFAPHPASVPNIESFFAFCG